MGAFEEEMAAIAAMKQMRAPYQEHQLSKMLGAAVDTCDAKKVSP